MTGSLHLKPDVDAIADEHGDTVTEKPVIRPKLRKSIAFVTTFLGGLFAGVLLSGSIRSPVLVKHGYQDNHQVRGLRVRAAPSAGATQADVYPPTAPTSVSSALFPSNVGYPGSTSTGAEPDVIETAPGYPVHTSTPELVAPQTFGDQKVDKGFDLLKYWGNLSPWYSIEKGTWGLNSTPEAPDTCCITDLHFLHRHGARYPTSGGGYGSLSDFATRLHNNSANWNASGDLTFLNKWTYKLGAEILTPFGRRQMYDLGVDLRIKYGYILNNFTKSNTVPVFRTESEDRMLKSAINFALGFFGYPLDGQYEQSITIEAAGFNNSLAPYYACTNSGDPTKGSRGSWYIQNWTNIYLVDARNRLQDQITGYNLTIEDAFAMQYTCAYETVALGYSEFCGRFTEDEWKGFEYALDLGFWYNNAFGSPVGRAQGIGYIQEMIARLTNTPIATHNSSTNSTLDDNPFTFPLGQSLYVDATHEVVVLNIITALNLTYFANNGPLPYDHIPKNQTFKSSQLAPFGTHIEFQLLECGSVEGQQIRIVINDGVTPLTGINGCPDQKDGMCPLDTFVAAMKEQIATTDFNYACLGNWTVPVGNEWNTTTGYPPQA